MNAIIMDGKAIRDEILTDLTERVSSLAARGIVPGLATILVAALPCTPRGIVHLLRRYGIEIEGARIAVVGRGVTVGRPLGLLLTRRTESATVTLCHTMTKDLADELKRSDIVIAAAGVPKLITAEMIKPGAAVIDVGITRTADGLQGDVAADVASVAQYLTPNPGGVGPLTRAFLLANVVERAERTASEHR